MKFQLGVAWVTNKGLEDEDRIWFIEGQIDTTGYPVEIASPGALRPARPGYCNLAQIVNWNISMKFNQCLPLEVLNKIKPEYVSQELDCSEVYPEYKNCFLLIKVDVL